VKDAGGGEQREGKKRNALAYTGLVRKPEGTRPLGRPWRRWVDRIKKYYRVGRQINLAPDRKKW
jgi:hypothetical protein